MRAFTEAQLKDPATAERLRALVERGSARKNLLLREAIDKVRFANGTYEAMHKDDAGNAVVTTLRRSGVNLVFTPSWDAGPAWPVVQPARPVVVRRKRSPEITASRRDMWRRCVVLPDMQIGYWRNTDGILEPTHDEAAISIALQVIAAFDPDEVVMVGDNLDLPELSK